MKISAISLVALLIFFAGCAPAGLLRPSATQPVTGSSFYAQAASYNWKKRDSLSRQLVLQGATPAFLRKFVRIRSTWKDSMSGKEYRVQYFVSPDYLSIGTNHDWARIHITPFLAQELADSLHCFLPTKKMVDQIYQQARVRLAPVPLYAFRDSTPTFFHHHLIVEGQRKGQRGLIAGIQKDIVTTGKLYTYPRQDRVAIYGWHQLNGKPIQPLYTGHVYWYVDYSQGVRLVYEKVKVNGKWLRYTELFGDPVLKNLLSDEADPGFGRYPMPGLFLGNNN